VEGSGGHRQGQSQLVAPCLVTDLAPCLVTNLSPMLSHNPQIPRLRLESRLTTQKLPRESERNKKKTKQKGGGGVKPFFFFFLGFRV